MAGLSSDEPSTSRTPTVVPAVSGPCPHTPPCPPPVCLAPGLRPQGTTEAVVQPVRRPVEPDPAASTGTDGYSVHTRSLWRFADTMIFSADTVDAVKQSTPRFDGWNLIPMGGIPISGLLFIGRFNAITDLWRDCADTLANLIKTDSAKIATAARRYQAAEEAGTIKTV